MLTGGDPGYVLHFGSLDLEKFFVAVGPNTAYKAHPSKP